MRLLPKPAITGADVDSDQPPWWLAHERRIALGASLTYALIGISGMLSAALNVAGGLRSAEQRRLMFAAVQGIGFLVVTAALLYVVIALVGARLSRLTRISQVLLGLHAVSGSPERAQQRAQRVCARIAAHGGFALAWVGLIDQETGVLRPIAHAGDDAGHTEALPAVLEAAALAIQRGAPDICADLARDHRTAPWRDALLARGLRSITTFPLHDAGEVVGAISFYARDPRAPHKEDIRLLGAVAAALSAALSADRHEREREQAEAALYEREQQYRLLTERIPDIIYRYALRPAPQYVYVSPVVTNILGYTPEDHYADPDLPRKYIHPDDRQLLEAAASQGSDAAAPQVLRCHHRDGHIVWLEYRTIMVERDPDDIPVALEGIVRDVTTREQAAPQLQLQRTALEATATAIVITTRDGTIEWVNPAFTTLTGYTADEVIGQNPRILRSAYQPSSFYQGLWATILRGEIWRGTLVNRRKNGSEYLEEQTITPVRVGGEIQHFVSIKQDITERMAVDRQRQALATIAETLRTAHNRAEMLPLLLEQTLLLLPAEGAAVALRDEATGESVMELGVGTWSSVIGRRLPPGAGITGRVIATGSPYRSNDIGRDPGFIAVTDEMQGASAALCVPLYAYDTVVGALWVARLNPFNESDLQTLNAMAGFAASAIHRAALFELTEQRLRRLAGLHAIDMAINGSLDSHLALGMLIDQARDLLQVDAVDILLLDPLQRALTFAAGRGFRTRGFELIKLRLGSGVAGQVAMGRQMMQLPNLTDGLARFTRHTLIEAEQFVSYYGVPLVAKGQVKGVLEVFHRTPLVPDQEWLAFLETLAGQAAIAIDNTELFSHLQQANMKLALAYDATIEGWSAALDLRDKETEGHTLRVTDMTERLARAVGIADDDLIHIRRGALLHDIGKMGVPDHILLKPGPLTPQEWVIMRQHPVYAYKLLAPIDFLRPALDIPYCHHEKWDGSGYPRGLRGREIPLAARLFAVVDVWDALVSDRPYRPGWPIERVLAHIRDGAGTHFDPQIVPLFLDLLDRADAT